MFPSPTCILHVTYSHVALREREKEEGLYHLQTFHTRQKCIACRDRHATAAALASLYIREELCDSRILHLRKLKFKGHCRGGKYNLKQFLQITSVKFKFRRIICTKLVRDIAPLPTLRLVSKSRAPLACSLVVCLHL